MKTAEIAEILREADKIYQDYLTRLNELKQRQNQTIVALIHKMEEKKLAQLQTELKK